MEKITTASQIDRVKIDIRGRMQHHAPAVTEVGKVLANFILGNASYQVYARKVKDLYGYSYKIITPTNQTRYITYDHSSETIFIKDKLRNFETLHTFNNGDAESKIIEQAELHLM